MEKAKIVFFGNERLATGVSTNVATLTSLIDAGYEVCAVVSNYEKGRSRSARDLEIKKVADSHSIPVLLPENPKDIADELKAFQADAGVLVAYGKIVPESIIDIFPYGIVNIHPSLLPLHRGPTPIESVLLIGEAKTGVSVMKLVKAMDAGPVYGYSEIDLNGYESKQQLADTLLEMGSTTLVNLLPGIIDGSVAAQPQDDSKATYDALIDKKDGKLDFNKSAAMLEREIRAYLYWPGSHTNLAGVDVIITKASTSNNSVRVGEVTVKEKQILIGCGEGSLKIESLKPAGKKEMNTAAFIAGYGSRI